VYIGHYPLSSIYQECVASPFGLLVTSPKKFNVAYNEPTVSKIVDHLESNFQVIKGEYMSACMGMRIATDPNSSIGVTKPLEPDYDVNRAGGESTTEGLHVGTWDWHSYLLNGVVQPRFQKSCPQTSRIVDEMSDHLFTGNPFGFCFFSTLQGNSYIKPHTGPMNLRLRIHLPLIVPQKLKPDAYSTKPKTKCGFRVGDQIRQWEEGKAIVFDDSYEHEVWNETDEVRVLLLVDIWHPDVRAEEREKTKQMFEFAKGQGWLKDQQT